jgi:hypothetical protein
MTTKSRFCITETRVLADGSQRIVDRATLPLRHARRAAIRFSEMSDSLQQSGLRGRVTVAIDDAFWRCSIDDGRLTPLYKIGT